MKLSYETPCFPTLDCLKDEESGVRAVCITTAHAWDHGHHQQFVWWLSFGLIWPPVFFYRGWLCFDCE